MWKKLFIKILPWKVYTEISYDISHIFSITVNNYPSAKSFFDNMSNHQIRKFSNKQVSQAKEYDPHETINDFVNFFSGLYKLAETFLLIILMISVLAGTGIIVAHSRDALDLIGFIGQLPILVILSGPTSIALTALSLLVYFRLLSLDSFAAEVLIERLTIEGAKMKTRDEQKLIGYSMWNSSLNGGVAFQILVIFSILWIFTTITPRYDPYGYIKKTIEENVNEIIDSDGVFDALGRVYEQKKSE